MQRVLVSRTSRTERGAEALATQALVGGGLGRGPTPGSAHRHRAAAQAQLPVRFGTMVGDVGTPLHPVVGREMGRRFAHDFSRVRIHSGSRAEQTCRRLGAEAYSVGNHVVLGPQARDHATGEGRRLLAHELAHVTQPGPPSLRLYRSRKAFNFGVANDPLLKEDSFHPAKDKSTKPWISLVKVGFATRTTDANGAKFWKGSATATYHNNPVKGSDFSFPVAGGSRSLGLSDAGTFTVHRIEGEGYNSGLFSGTPDPATREGPNSRYTKPDASGFRASNMSLAVFYNRGEALHEGPLDQSSHGCVHVNWGAGGTMKRLNYHSVIGLTKVIVSYAKKP
jgi:hypothetical protein